MKTTILFTLLSIILGGNISVAKVSSDSIKTKDQVFVDSLQEQFLELEFSNTEKAKGLLEQSISLAHKTGYVFGEAHGLMLKGYLFEDVGDFAGALSCYLETLRFSAKNLHLKGIADAYHSMGIVYTNTGRYPDAIRMFESSIRIKRLIHDELGIATSSTNLGVVYDFLGNYSDALRAHLDALRLNTKLGNTKLLSASYNNIGLIYSSQKDEDLALKNYLPALNYARQNDQQSAIPNIYENIGTSLKAMGYLHAAYQNCEAGLLGFKKLNDAQGMSRAYGNLGHILLDMGDLDGALKNQQESLQLTDQTGDLDGRAAILIALGNIYLKIGDHERARKMLQEGTKLANELGSKIHLESGYLHLSTLDTLGSQWKQAFYHYANYIAARDSLVNDEILKKNVQAQLNYEYQKKEDANKAAAERREAFAKTEMERQKWVRNSFVVGFILMLLFSFFVLRSYYQKRRANTLLANKNEIIQQQKEEVEQKNHEITQSIEYALRIQTAILPPKKLVHQYLEESFILYRPKDIVSGDFYWMETTGDLVLFAACDCTGHGVPGAMVSVVCHNALTRSVREFGLVSPANILNKTAELVMENFSMSEETIRDGMDISLCAYDKVKKVLLWAGANNPLWLISGGQLKEIKANKQAIGLNEEFVPFTEHHIELEVGDLIYLFSDGFADQFGGDTGEKKLTRKRFKELLLEVRTLPLSQQGDSLDRFIHEYRRGIEQIDDILVIGVKVLE